MIWKQRLLSIGVIIIYIQIIEINQYFHNLILSTIALIHRTSHHLNFKHNQNTFTMVKQHKIRLLCTTHKFRYWKTQKWGKITLYYNKKKLALDFI